MSRERPFLARGKAALRVGLLLGGLLKAFAASETMSSVPAFPDAEGFGRFARGGRGGRVVEVTTLADSGPGSLRAALTAPGPRTVVFRVGGTIELHSPIEVTSSFLTVAGQTAPGEGVQIKGEGIVLRDVEHVILRYLRIRPGPEVRDPSTSNALQILGRSSDVIVDHCSLSWATDQNMAIWDGPRRVTVQWCLIAEALENAGHAEGAHSKGLLIGWEGTTELTIHHNLFAHNVTRNPWIKSGAVDVVNNLVYNYRDIGIHISASDGPVWVNVVGNRYIHGPESDVRGIRVDGRLSSQEFLAQSSVYLKGNIVPGYRPAEGLPEIDALEWVFWTEAALTPVRHPFPEVTTTDAFQATAAVLDGAGARRPRLDAVDARILSQVRAALSGRPQGAIIDHPGEVGGWPELPVVSHPEDYDTDHDGMPDTWERDSYLDPARREDGVEDADGDGWTNLEEFLNGTDPRRSDWTL